MASKESQVVRDHWTRGAEEAQRPADPTEKKIDHWGDLTGEPGGVDYLEIEVAGLPAMWAVPKGAAHDRVLLSVHGGGNVSGSIYTHRKLFAHLAKAVGARALLTEYRQRPHPEPLDDTVTAYRWLLDQGVRPEHIALVGDSFGGGLSLTSMLRARELGLPTAAAIMLISPWVDMTVGNQTFETNDATDPFFKKQTVQWLADKFLNGVDPKEPLVSPLYADLRGLPPVFVQVGGDETLVGEGVELAETARKAGVDTQLEVFPEQLHTFQMAAGYAPESDDAIAKFAAWVRPRLGLA
ncbi:alpha/beta hydrolase [Pseudonocardia acaciae]|uniref:alpha/beta hydrolase n=1 Tax=Pseudonocardia acaciae TaxID=551276 RepID=UPI00048F26E0|nr:alpha/beta hydrolase [Pseudonocardia acaciae]